MTRPGAEARRERAIVLALCLAAALRALVFGAAFPFFNPVDEESHVDLVLKYSRGEIPSSSVTPLEDETLRAIVLYSSQEYLAKRGTPARTVPGWRDPDLGDPTTLSEIISDLRKKFVNQEAGSFPLYYVVAGAWLRLGQVFGLDGGRLLYWIRFLDPVVLAALVWSSFWIARSLLPDGRLERLGVPLLIAFLPQSTFYSVNSDVPTALLFALAFGLLLQLATEDRSIGFHAIAGVAVSATFLTKFSNVPVLGLLGLVAALRIRDPRRLGVLLATGVLPGVFWLLRNEIVLGDLFGSAAKVAHLQWTVKPVAEWWQHPIFTPAGFGYFLSELTKRFWRGELSWHREPLASYSADFFYVASTALFLAASGIALARGGGNPRERLVLLLSAFVIASSVLLLAGLSIRFDFDGCFYPSRESPYFVSGRLIGGALLPFMLLYVDGLRRLLEWTRSRIAPLTALAVVAAIMFFSELGLMPEVFRSPFNWYHLG